jgi:hypothetical protein
MDLPPVPHPQPDPAPVPVRVLTRVVAAGIVQDSGKHRLRASLAFLPEPATADEIREDQSKPADQRQLVDLTKWPSEIEKRYRGGGTVTLNAAKVVRGGDRVLPANEVGKPTVWTRRAPPRDSTMPYLVSLWRHLLAPPVKIEDLVFDLPGVRPEDKSATNDSRRVLETHWGQYVDATAAFADPWGYLCAALRQSLAGSAVQKIMDEGTKELRISSVPYAEAAVALSAFRMQATTETALPGVRQRVREQVKFVVDGQASGVMTKLGRLAAGPRTEADSDMISRAIGYAAARNVLVGPQTFRELARQSATQNVSISRNAAASFARRHGIAAPNEVGIDRFAWRGQRRESVRWRFAELFGDRAFAASFADQQKAIAERKGEQVSALAVGRQALDVFARRSSNALVQHFWSMRAVPHELNAAQKADVAGKIAAEVKAAAKEQRKLDPRIERGKAEAEWRRLDRAARQIVEAPGRRFFGLQSFPTLARLFNLVIDVEIDLETFNSVAEIPQPAPGAAPVPASDWLYRDEAAVDFESSEIDLHQSGPRTARAVYLQLAQLPAVPAAAQAARAIWSVVKLRQPGAIAGDRGHFWPVTFVEIENIREVLAAEKAFAAAAGDAEKQTEQKRKENAAASRLPEHDGIVDLGFAKGDKARFELDNLDFAQSLEHYANAAEGQQAAVEGGAPLDRAGQGMGTARTGGLALLDTMRALSETDKAQTTTAQVNQHAAGAGNVLDASMLAIGYRLDVGVQPRNEPAGHRFVWRSLMNRIVEYADPRDGADGPIKQKRLERALAELKFGKEERIRLDSGMVRTPSKMIALDRNRDPAKAEAIANEDIVVWTGDPLGLECGGADERTSEVEVDPSRDLPLTIVYDLPQDLPPQAKGDRESYTPPRLEFGRGYRIGLRTVYLGGVTLPLERAAARYEKAKDGTLTLPPRGSNGHRFLREEAIDPPVLALSERVHKAPRHADQPWDTAEWAIVRTGSDPRLKPESTTRVVVPPSVPMEYAVLHRIKTWNRTIGSERIQGVRLIDGLANVNLDPYWGGLPSLDEKRRELVHQPKPESRREQPDKVYDAVFQVKATSDEDHARRRQPYYPDPAARQLAIEVVTRRPDAERKEDPLIVALDAPEHEVRYPDYVPVLIEVIAAKADAPRKRIAESDPEADVGVLQPGGNFVKQAWRNWRQSSGTVRVRRVRIHLRPGEDYDVRMWCPPRSLDIANWFQAGHNFVHYQHMLGTIQSRLSAETELGARALRAIGVQAPRNDDLTIIGGVLGAMGDAQAGIFVGTLEKRLNGKALPPHEGVVVPDGVDARLFRLITDHLASSGHEVAVPGFAKQRTMRVTHAIQQPSFAPCFVGLGAEPPACVTTNDGGKLIAIVRKEFDETSGAGVPKAGAPGSQTPAGDDKTRPGWLLNHPDPTKWTALPHTGHDNGAADAVFGGRVAIDLDTSSQLTLWAWMATVSDDVKRKRDRTKPLPKPSSQLPQVGKPLPDEPFSIYGFRVDANGKATFPQQRIELLRTRDLSAEIHAQKVDDLVEKPEILDLAFTPAGAVREYERRHRFTTSQAAKLGLELEAHSRFEHMLLRETAPKEPALKPVDPITRPGAKSEIWLPATRAPDPIDRKSLLPAFVWTERFDGTDIERRTKVRIRVKRPWFSSGEGEKLAIVLWPPEIVDPLRRDEIARDVARDLVKSQGGVTAYKEYKNFEDSDLGPGGQFVTRWGSDAIRHGPVQTGYFMPLEAFRDALPDGNADLVARVQMPIPRGDNDDDATAASKISSPVPQNTMLVSLVAYEPLFDMANESWYVDAEISSLALANPFVRLGLVRYQKHAPPEWQVSEPIVEFIQLLPRRHVVITAEARNAGSYPIRVDVYGPAHDLVALAPEDKSDAGAKADAMHRPVLKARVLRHPEGTDFAGGAGDGMVPEVVAADSGSNLLKWNSAEHLADSQPRRGEEGLQWSFRFVLKDDPRKTPHFVFMEEVEWMLPTDPDAESVRQGRDPGDSIVAETGPRFALKLRIKG